MIAAQMEQGPSLLLFAAVMVAVGLVIAVSLPPLLRRMSLSTSVIAIGLIGPLLGVLGGVLGTGAMTLSGRDVTYALLVSCITAAAAVWVALGVARPVARDLQTVVDGIDQVASGERTVETQVERGGEIGRLGNSVERLAESLSRAETERLMAEDERLGVVTALSHDLRTPLAALLVSVDALEDGLGSSAEHLTAIRSNVLSLERLVDDLFLLARADSGSLELSFEDLDMGEMVDEAIDALSPVAGKKGVDLRAEIEGPSLVRGDHAALGRVLRNLLDNAVRHAPTGTAVTVSAAHSDQDDKSVVVRDLQHSELIDFPRMVEIEVRDEGQGFDEAFTSVALERFTQADHARSGGAGLGLSISHALLAAHEGAIQVCPGPGGRVLVTLPCQNAVG